MIPSYSLLTTLCIEYSMCSRTNNAELGFLAPLRLCTNDYIHDSWRITSRAMRVQIRLDPFTFKVIERN